MSNEKLSKYVIDNGIFKVVDWQEFLEAAKKASEVSGVEISPLQIAISKGVLTPEKASDIEKKSKKHIHEIIPGYDIIDKFVHDAFGPVYSAVKLENNEAVSIKVVNKEVLEDDFLNRVQREIEASKKLNHAHIVSVRKTDEYDKYIYFEMDQINGETLESKLQKDTIVSTRDALDFVRQMASALAHASKRGFIHRNVSPEKIVINEVNQAILIDFGMCKYKFDENITPYGMTFGNPYYISPEQARGNSEVDHRSDIYSLGATLFHMLCGRPAYIGTGTIEVMKKHCNDSLPEPKTFNSKLPDEVSVLIKKMMDKDPEKRYQNYIDLVKDIEATMEGKAWADMSAKQLKAGLTELSRIDHTMMISPKERQILHKKHIAELKNKAQEYKQKKSHKPSRRKTMFIIIIIGALILFFGLLFKNQIAKLFTDEEEPVIEKKYYSEQENTEDVDTEDTTISKTPDVIIEPKSKDNVKPSLKYDFGAVKIVNTIKGFNGYVTDGHLSSSGKYILAYEDGIVKVFDDAGMQVFSSTSGKSKLRSFGFVPNEESFIISDIDTISVYNMKEGRFHKAATISHNSNIYDASFSLDGKQLYVSLFGKITVWETKDYITKDIIFGPSAKIKDVGVAGQDNIFAGGENNNFQIINLKDRQTVKNYHFNDIDDYGMIEKIDHAQNGEFAVTCHQSKYVPVWDMNTGKLLTKLTHPSKIFAIAVSPDCNLIATGGFDNKLYIWDIKTKNYYNYPGHSNTILTVRFSPDGEYVITGGVDRTVLVWKLTK